jgi:hypothetical protein
MFFAVWKHAPIKTTLLRELEEVCDVTYREFEDPQELRSDLQHFFRRIAKGMASGPLDLSPRRWIARQAEHSNLPVSSDAIRAV